MAAFRRQPSASASRQVGRARGSTSTHDEVHGTLARFAPDLPTYLPASGWPAGRRPTYLLLTYRHSDLRRSGKNKTQVHAA